MDTRLHGEIIVDDGRSGTGKRNPHAPRALRAFIQKHLGRWFWLHGIAPSDEEAHFEVRIRRDSFEQIVDCRVEVEIRGQRWRGADYGSGPQQAFLAALQNLTRSLKPAMATS